MIGKIVRHELRAAWCDGRLCGVLLLTLGLIVVATLVGAATVRDLQAQRDEATAVERANWLAQGPKNPHGAAHFGQYAFKPVSGLALFDRGVDRYLGVAVWLEAHRQNPTVHRPADDAPAVQRFGDLTAAMILQVIGPLLALLLTFQTVAAERERGTLRLLLGQGVSPRTLVLGKLAAAMLALVPLLLVAVLAAIALDGASTRVALLALAYALYLGCFVALGTAISARARNTSAALVSALALWVTTVIVVPRLVGDLAAWAHPSPSEHEFFAGVTHDIKEGINGHDPQDRRMKALEAELLARHGVKDVEELPVNLAGVALQAGEDYGDHVYDHHYAELRAIHRQQADLRLGLAFVSPLLALRPVSTALCGTDVAAHQEFTAAAEAHRRALVRRLNDDIVQRPGADPFKFKAGPELWHEVDALAWQPLEAPPPDLRGLVALAALLGLSLTLAVAATRRLAIDP